MDCDSIFAEKMETSERRVAALNVDNDKCINKYIYMDKPYIDDQSGVISGYKVIKVKR